MKIKATSLFVSLILAFFVSCSQKPPAVDQAPPKTAEVPVMGSVKADDWEIVKLPGNLYVDQVAFGEKGEIALIGEVVLFSKDEGKTWKTIKSGKGYINCSRNGGETFSGDCGRERAAKLETIYTKDAGSPETAAVTNDGRLYFSTTYEHTGGVWSIPLEDQKENWFVLNFTYADVENDNLDVYSTRHMMFSLGDRVVADAVRPPNKLLLLTTDDQGKTWIPFYSEHTREFCFIDDKTGFVLGKDIRKTSDGGKNWEIVADLPAVMTEFEKTRDEEDMNIVVSMNFADENKGYMTGTKGFLAITNDGGKTWQKKNVNFGKDLWGVRSLDAKYAWVVGDDGFVLETSDGGDTWHKIDFGFSEDLYSNLYENDLQIDKVHRTVWLRKAGKLYRKAFK